MAAEPRPTIRVVLRSGRILFLNIPEADVPAMVKNLMNTMAQAAAGQPASATITFGENQTPGIIINGADIAAVSAAQWRIE